MFLHKKQSYPLYFYVNMLEKELALKVSIPFLAPNAAQMCHRFLPLKSQFLDVMIHPEADRQTQN